MASNVSLCMGLIWLCRNELCDAAGEVGDVLGLEDDAAGAGEFCEEEAFAAEEDVSEAFDRLNFIADSLFEGDYVAGIDFENFPRGQMLFYGIAIDL